MAILATRAMTIQGRTYRVGEPVEGLSSDKVQQFIDRRWLRDTSVEAATQCVALRPMTIQGRAYQRGERVDVTGLSSLKLSQLIEHRMLDLAPSGRAKASGRRQARPA